MATKKKKISVSRAALENVAAAGLGTAIGYGAGAGSTKLLTSKGPYARRLRRLDRAKALREVRALRGVAGAGATAVGGLAGLAARQRIRKARNNSKLSDKLASLR